MEFVSKALPLCLLLTSTLAQFDNYGYEVYEPKQPVQPVHHHINEHYEEYDTDFHAHPKYSFDYAVKDPHTGDDKEHWETRDGDKVKGSYTVIETDGTKRIVEYEADDKNGFNAVVHRIGNPHHNQEFKPKEYTQEFKPKEYVYKEPLYVEPHYSRFQDFQSNEAQDDGFIPIVPNYRN